MIDAHYAISPSLLTQEREDFFKSVHNEKINLIEVSHVEGNTNAMRAEGYSAGNNPFVCRLDPDDRVIEGAFEVIKDAIKKYPECSAYFTDHYVTGLSEGRWVKTHLLKYGYAGISRTMHHIVVFNRKAVQKATEALLKYKTDYLLFLNLAALSLSPVCFINTPQYIWNRKSDGAHVKNSSVCIRRIPYVHRAKLVAKELSEVGYEFSSKPKLILYR